MLYEILTGEIAFDAPSEFVTMKMIVEGRLPQRAVGGLHEGVAACIRKALAVDPEERFSTASALAEALEGVVLHDAAPPARPSRSRAVTRIPEPAEITEEVPDETPVVPAVSASSEPAAGLPPPLPETLPEPRTQPPSRRPRPPAAPRAMPLLAATLNLTVVLTGAGQVMNGQIGKGIAVMIIHWTLALVTCFSSVPFTIIIAALDAWLVARKLNAGRRVGSWESL